MPQQAASSGKASAQALQEAFEKHPAASFPLAQFLSMDPAVSHWVPQQPFGLPHQRQPSPHQQQMHASSTPHQRQPSPQHMQQGLLRSINASPLPPASGAVPSVVMPTSSGAA